MSADYHQYSTGPTPRNRIFMRESAGPCEVHTWPDEGLPARLVAAMRERHGKGGLNCCVDCIDRAKRVADAERAKR
jgi:hypothetical protein